jgi:hypothetical protein
MFGKHPWSIGGGGAADLQSTIEGRASVKLAEMTTAIGRAAHTGNDEAYVAEAPSLHRRGIAPEHIACFVEGERLRDWLLGEPTSVLFPYDSSLLPMEEAQDHPVIRWLWLFRDQLWNRREPNGTHREIGKTWHEFSRFHPDRFSGMGIAYAEITTHNHFVFDLQGKIFNRTAPVLKLPADITEDQHLALLGLLNSSTAGFWLRQVSFPKGGSGIGRGVQDESWEMRFAFDATKVA